MCSNMLQINTKGMCLLCLNPSHSPPSRTHSNYFTSVPGFEKLLSYLEVNTNQLINNSLQFVHNVSTTEDIPVVNTNEDFAVGVNLCFGCSLVTDKFHQLYKQYEVIRRQFDNCVQFVHQSIKNADESPTRVGEYNKRMKVEPLTISELLNASLAASFRSETLKKCCSKLKTGTTEDLSDGNDTTDTTPNVPSTSRVNVPVISTSSSGLTSININRSQENGQFRRKRCSKSIPCPSQSQVPPQLRSRIPPDVSINIVKAPVSHVTTAVPVAPTENRPREEIADIVEDNDHSPPTPPQDIVVNNFPVSNDSHDDNLDPDDNINSVRADTHRQLMKRCSECSLLVRPGSLRKHKLLRHPELFIRKHVPPQFKRQCTPVSCKAVVNLRVPQECVTHHSVKCPYCVAVIKSRRNMKYHMVSSHAAALAKELLSYIKRPIPGESESASMDFEPELPPLADSPQGDGGSGREGGFNGLHIKCDVCGDTFTSTAALTMHKNRNGMATNACSLCSYTATCCSILKSHERSVHPVAMVTREVPGWSEEEVAPVMAQIIADIPKDDNRCALCGEESGSLGALKRHFLVAHFEELVDFIKITFGRRHETGECN